MIVLPQESLPVTSDTIRASLRLATGAVHDRLHGLTNFTALLRADLLPTEYARLLLRLLGLHSPIEERLARHDGDALMVWRQTAATPSRPARLRSDLAFLGIDQGTIDTAPQADVLLLSLHNPAAALGCAWVVEGSSLGGRVLSLRLDAILGAGRAAGAGTFLASHPGQTDRWSGCCAAVEACGADNQRRATMTAAGWRRSTCSSAG
jgi:heme oxygenase